MICICVLGALLLLASLAANADEFSGRVVGVHDGDTLTLLTADQQHVKIRLAGIDAPEQDQPFGQKAKQALSALVFNQTVRVVVQAQDDYGRMVGTVYVGARNVNAALVEQGTVWVYRRYNRDPALPGLEAQAQAVERGLWALPESQRIPPWEWRHGEQEGVATKPASPRSAPPSRPAMALTCGSKRRCGEMANCEEARFYLRICGVKSLDRDVDGVPCESLCR